MKYGAPRPVNAQNIFNKSASHLMAQKQRCETPNSIGRCMYRRKLGRKNLACAVGCLITDKQADKADECDEIADALKYARVGWDWETHIDLLMDLQNVHDDKPVDQWAVELRRVAAKHNLDASVIGNV